MTPRKDWTLDNLPTTAAIRFHCTQFCRCSAPPEKTPNQQSTEELRQQVDKQWNILIQSSVRMGVFQTSAGDIRLETVVTTTSTTYTTNVQIVTANGTITCEPSDSWLCQKSWPSSIAAKPTAPPSIPNESYNATTQSVGTCGLSKTCTSQASCGNSTSCKCTEPDTQTAQKYGLDPVFPSPICLAITALIVGGTYSPLPKAPGTGKRGLSLDHPQVVLNGDGEPWRCLCNSTYTSTACCLVDNGMVWEEAVEKRGHVSGLKK